MGSSMFIAACGIFSCSMWILSYGMWDLVPWPGIKPKPPALGAQSISHGTTKEEGFPGGTSGKEPTCQCRSLIPGLGGSPREGNGNPLQYSCLENPMDRGTWWAVVHRITKSKTWLKWLSTQGANKHCENPFWERDILGTSRERDFNIQYFHWRENSD